MNNSYDTPLDCFSRSSLLAEMQKIRDFYEKYSINREGGFYQSIDAQGNTVNHDYHHLVSSCRMTTNFCRTALMLDNAKDIDIVMQGLDFIESVHKREDGKGYHWSVQDGEPRDTDQYCYGYAFLVLTYANAYKAGIEGAKQNLELVKKLMDNYFWEPEIGLYADQYSLEKQALLSYRGQNANMHACEAFISAFDATGEKPYLERAFELAKNIVCTQTQTTKGLIWEHYKSDWSLDLDYNLNDPKNLYKPWGYQPGHFTEWAKLLLILNHFSPQEWLCERALFLLEKAIAVSWDEANGGLFYGFAPDGSICDDEKYFWVQAETLAALSIASSKLDNSLSDITKALLDYVNRHFIYPETGVWRRVLTTDNLTIDDWVALPGAKCDYHTLGSFHDILIYGDVTL